MVADLWGSPHFFSIWYPPAGVRFAAMWILGPRWVVPIIFSELFVQYSADFVVMDQGLFDQIFSVVRPTICYGLAIWALTRLSQGSLAHIGPVMQLLFGVVSGPLLVATVVAVGGWLRPEVPPFTSGANPLMIVTAFLVGDMLGVILIAPPLLWLYHKLSGQAGNAVQRPRLTAAQLSEILAVFVSGTLFASLFLDLDASLSAMPITVSILWIGLRYGRTAAWVSLVSCAAIILLWSTQSNIVADQFELHVGIATMALAAFLADSYSDNQLQMQQEIARRDRMLFQAERLKSLKAMSLAVIHDASQPLTTLALETQHLANVSTQLPLDEREIQETARLFQRKVQHLSDMVQRLRRFGGRSAEDMQICSIAHIITVARELLKADKKKLGGVIDLQGLAPEMNVLGRQIELTQAIFNLIHNAVLSSRHQGFVVEAGRDGAYIQIKITKPIIAQHQQNGGFGIGYHISRTIVEAHNGQLSSTRTTTQFETIIRLPEALSDA